MKKFIKSCALLMVAALCSTVFVACGEDPTGLTTNMISLSFTSVAYDGTEKKPEVTVTVDEEIISSDEYTVEYADNTEAGNATVKVIANEDSKIISGSVIVGFMITKAETSVSSLSDLESKMGNANYDVANLSSAIIIENGDTVSIPEGFTVNMGENQLTIQSGAVLNINGLLTAEKPIINNGIIDGDGEYISFVEDATELRNSLKDADKIVLNNNIEAGNDETFLTINAQYTKSGIVIDLNGKTISGYDQVAVVNNTSLDFNINIKNGTIIGTDDNFALTVFHGASKADKYVVVLEDLVAVSGESGISTNGYYSNATIIAKNCTFGAKAGDYGLTSSTITGVYLPAQYVYKFENCTFNGLTGYYTKSGDHTLTNCTVNGFKTEYTASSYNGSGANETGSGLVADSASGYQTPLKITIKGGTFTSVSGYAIEEVVTTSTSVEVDYTTLIITGSPTLNSANGKEDKIIITNEVE